jgi:hypothetical protein
MNLDAYDDMMGLEFGDYEGMEQFLSTEMLREALIASTAGGGAILLSAWAVKKAAEQMNLSKMIENPLLRAAVVSGGTLLLGVVAGRSLYEYNREAAMGVVGGIGGFAMANFLEVALSQMTGEARMAVAQLGESGSDSYMMGYGNDEGMAALAALETTGVTSAPGAFQGFADSTVTPEALFGLEGTVVQQETLGGLAAYAPHLA